MTFTQTTRRERILIYGSFKLGKSTCWLDVADAIYRAGNPDNVHFYVIDTDFGVGKLLDEGYGHLESMMTIYNPVDFGELLEASKAITKKAGRGDWIIIDMVSYPWSMAQEFYIEGVYGSDPENYFIQMRQEVVAKGGKDKRAFGGHDGTDWGFITKVYKRFEFPLTMQTEANTFGVTEERKLDAERGATTDEVKQYKAVNSMAPVGQKGIGHRFDTILRMTMRANGQRQLTMAGDRGRQKTIWTERDSNVLDIGPKKKEGFAYRYLVDIAGWEGEGQESKVKAEADDAETTKSKRKTNTRKPPTRRR